MFPLFAASLGGILRFFRFLFGSKSLELFDELQWVISRNCTKGGFLGKKFSFAMVDVVLIFKPKLKSKSTNCLFVVEVICGWFYSPEFVQ
jgi:hypothetical protein